MSTHSGPIPEPHHYPRGGAHEHESPVDSIQMYFTIWLILMGFMVLTLLVWRFHFGIIGTVIAVAIASIKAVLVVLYFMHVRHASRITWVFAGAAFLWLAILLVLTFNDYWTRAMTAHGLALEERSAKMAPQSGPQRLDTRGNPVGMQHAPQQSAPSGGGH